MNKYILQFCGGDLDGEYHSDNPLITRWASGKNINLRQREELQGKPTFKKYAGPMYNGTKKDVFGNEIPIIRYESTQRTIKQSIYCLYVEGYDSYDYKLRGITTSMPKIINEILTLIEQGEVCYIDDDKPIQEHLDTFDNVDTEEFIETLNETLERAYIKIMEDGIFTMP